MSIPTMHFRWYGSRTQPVLQQLFVFNAAEAGLLAGLALTDANADVFADEPNHLVSEWLTGIRHEWRNVPFVESP